MAKKIYIKIKGRDLKRLLKNLNDCEGIPQPKVSAKSATERIISCQRYIRDRGFGSEPTIDDLNMTTLFKKPDPGRDYGGLDAKGAIIYLLSILLVFACLVIAVLLDKMN